MIQAIVFDCFGLLTTDLFKEFMATLPVEQRNKASDLNHAYDRGDLTRDDFLRELKELSGREPQEVEHLSDKEIYKNTDLLNCIGELKKDYMIGLLSNISTNWITDCFLDETEQELFDAFVFSYEIGATKPEPIMFETIAEKLGVSMDSIVMIDDTERYCTAAIELGMKAIWYQDFQQMKTELNKILQS
jgi:HAD superfamily hydrolase (TIGR01509 family)